MTKITKTTIKRKLHIQFMYKCLLYTIYSKKKIEIRLLRTTKKGNPNPYKSEVPYWIILKDDNRDSKQHTALYWTSEMV